MEAKNHDSSKYVYDAFISYRHVERDRKWAKWLLDAFESYKVPKELQKGDCHPNSTESFVMRMNYQPLLI
ncbi:MAG: hypothetical protein JXA79_11960 [Deltaproteobacteria bacterium]|nr:hypothetical protein [Deltaproteobacteria bacterium]